MADITVKTNTQEIAPLLNPAVKDAVTGVQTPAPVQAPAPPMPTPAQAGFQAWIGDPLNQSAVSKHVQTPNQKIIPDAPPMQATSTPVDAPPAWVGSGSLPDGIASQPSAIVPPKIMSSAVSPPQDTLAPSLYSGGMSGMAGAVPSLPAAPGAAHLQTQSEYFAANPNQQATSPWAGKLLGPKGLNILAAGLAGAGGGLRGDSGAGLRYVSELNSQAQQAPDLNAQGYQRQVLQPYQTAIANSRQKTLDTANVAHTEAETKRISDAESRQLAQHGFKTVTDPATGVSSIVPDEESPVYKQQQTTLAKGQAATEKIKADIDNTKAQQELREAQTELARSKNDPNSPAYKLAQQRLAVAQQNASTAVGRLGLATKNYHLRFDGSDGEGNTAAGALVADDGRTVGTANALNVRATGVERNKADLATSAHDQLQVMREIATRRKDEFGPLSGRKTDFNVWLGSQDPDAQAFRAASTIASDHLAGVFGGRSETALHELKDATGRFKDNPDAVLSGIDRVDKSTVPFISKGTMHTRGSNIEASAPNKKANPLAPPVQSNQSETIPASVAAQLQEGVSHTFGNGQVWTKSNGTPKRLK